MTHEKPKVGDRYVGPSDLAMHEVTHVRSDDGINPDAYEVVVTKVPVHKDERLDWPRTFKDVEFASYVSEQALKIVA